MFLQAVHHQQDFQLTITLHAAHFVSNKYMETLTSYLVEQYQPICGLILGVAMLVFTFLINFGNTKIRATKWVKRKLYDNNVKSDYLTRRLMDGIIKYFTLLGLMLIILAIFAKHQMKIMDNLISTFQQINFASLFVLMLSMILIFGSLLETVSKRYGRELQDKIRNELPENRDFLESKEGIEATWRARIWTLAFGIFLFLLWLFLPRFWI
jgi:hypothetical protein